MYVLYMFDDFQTSLMVEPNFTYKCVFLGDEYDFALVWLETKKRNGIMAGKLCYKSGLQRSQINHEILVHLV